MGRTEQALQRLRERIAADTSETFDAESVASALEALSEKVPKADGAVVPALERFAGGLRGVVDSERALSLTRAVVDAAIQYASHRDHPQRPTLLEALDALVAAAGGEEDVPAPAPCGATTGAAPAGLPATFVGELPPESTVDDAALLLVQLEPGDRYGIASLIEILERLALDQGRTDSERDQLLEGSRLLASAGDQAALDRVGAILEAVGEGPDAGPAQVSRPAAAGDPGEGSAVPATAGVPADGAALPAGAPGDAAEATVAVAWKPGADADHDLLREFLLESGDLLRSAEQSLLALEADPADVEAVNVVFRAFHTIKGTSAFLGVEQAAELCHHAEGLLSRVRDGVLAFDTDVADLSLASVDVLGRVLDDVGTALDGGEPAGAPGLSELIAGLQSVAAGRGRPASGMAARTAGDPAPAPSAADRPAGPAASPGTRSRDSGGGVDRETSVRVRTDRLDRLVDMVGELVIAHSMTAQDTVVQADEHHDLAKKVAHAGKIVRELQDLSMALRMVPLKSTFAKLQRLVRDLARKSGKQVRLEMEGEDTEIDRTMVDILGDPLVHMIRNAVDHGIEPPADREAAGKPGVGTLWLRSYHAGGNVVVELEDDGRGMNRDRIVAKAVERGLIRTGEGLTDGEVWKLVFEAGFSTADKVTDVSGRGVGMDVVRRNIETLRGRIEVDSTFGSGTRVTLRLPLTLAITEGMLMRVGRERYILPTLSIERNIRPTPDMLSTVAGRGEMLLLREELLPIVRLHDLFGVAGGQREIEQGLLVVIGVAERRCALLVDELLGQQQVVVKSLGDGLGKVKGVTGGAVLGDGTVGLILDAGELVSMARGGSTAQAA